jgi:Mg-chelatase subunit ChlI
MSTWRRELGDGIPAPEARVVSPGRLTTANRQHLAMDEAEIDDWLIEDILDLLNDALGG